MGRLAEIAPLFQAAVIACLTLIAMMAGCGAASHQASHREREESNLGALTLIYCQYLAASHGVPPRDESELRAFAEELPQDLSNRLGADPFDGLMTSPRDNLPYVVVYGNSTQADRPASGVIVYEQKGVDGTRWVGRSTGTTSELSESELRKLIPGS